MILNNIAPLNFGTSHYELNEPNPISNPKTPRLNHTSTFFRYGDTDETLYRELLKRGKNQKLNILSAGCSYGEEVYSAAMALDSLEQKPNIIGIDVSPVVIEGAKKGAYFLDNKEQHVLTETQFPEYKHWVNSPYETAMKEKFHQNFELSDEVFCEYTKKDRKFENCDFQCASILDIDKMFEPNSQDAILCRMVLYHLPDEDVVDFFKKAYTILKPDGLLCLETFGHYDYGKMLQELGFRQPFKNALSIFSKPSLNEENLSSYRQFIIKPDLTMLNNKFDFDYVD